MNQRLLIMGLMAVSIILSGCGNKQPVQQVQVPREPDLYYNNEGEQ